MIKLKAIKETKILIKGEIYNAVKATNRQFFIQTQDGNDIGWYWPDHFTDMNGKEIKLYKFERDILNEIEVGSIVVCKVNTYKYLIKGGKYRISEKRKLNTWYTFIKLEGYDKELIFNEKTFRLLSKRESRNIKLDAIFDKPEDFKVKKQLRKIEQFDNKYQKLFEILSKSALETKRHRLDVIDWAIQKTGKELDLKKEDFDELLNMPLKDIIGMFT